MTNFSEVYCIIGPFLICCALLTNANPPSQDGKPHSTNPHVFYFFHGHSHAGTLVGGNEISKLMMYR